MYIYRSKTDIFTCAFCSTNVLAGDCCETGKDQVTAWKDPPAEGNMPWLGLHRIVIHDGGDLTALGYAIKATD